MSRYQDIRPHAAVVTEDLVKSYGTFRAVDGLNLQVPMGGVYGLLGPNGAGKSTTMKLLLGLTRPTGGRMWMLGQNVGSGKRAVAPGRVGSMIVSTQAFPGWTTAVWWPIIWVCLPARHRPCWPRWG